MLQITAHQAFMLAADHIEGNPKEFNFASRRQPSALDCGTPGCALGWIGYFMHTDPKPVVIDDRLYSYFDYNQIGERCGFVRASWVGLTRPEDFEEVFYGRMDELHANRGGLDWRESAQVCADMLRKYAETYHPVEVTK